MYKVTLILDKIFLKYERGGQIDPSHEENLPSKSPALLGSKDKKPNFENNETAKLIKPVKNEKIK